MKVIYAETAGYDLIIAVDGDEIRYTDDTLLDALERETGRDIFGLNAENRAQVVFTALKNPDTDISGWTLAEDEGLTLKNLLSPEWGYDNPDGVRVIAEVMI